MKRFAAILTLSIISAIPALADGEKTKVAEDKNTPVVIPLQKEIVKSGWNFGILPAFNYNNDLGFSIGALAQIFDYGDGTVYPNYRHKFTANFNIYSRGAKQIWMNYDSKHLIPGKRVTASLSYMDNPLCGFYGFNGAVSPYHADLDLHKSADGSQGLSFYSVHQKQLIASLDLQGRITDYMTWIGGASYSWQQYADVNYRVYDGTESLYHQYVENGLIPEPDTHGQRFDVKGGVVYDTRDFETNPERGIYASVTASAGASFSSQTRASVLLSADIRQYVPLWPGRLTWAWQIAYRGLMAGSLPFYALQGFSMRGSFGSRIVGNGVAWASTDLRLRLASFRALRQNFEIGLVGFADAGAAVQPYKLQEQTALGSLTFGKQIDDIYYGPYASVYDPAIATHERLHSSAGGGFWFAMNRNFLVAVEFGKPLNPQDGTMGVYINMGFSF